MAKRVLTVGHCDFDHGSISRLLRDRFGAETDSIEKIADALAALKQHRADLVLVNRVFEFTGEDGIELIRQMKADPSLIEIPVMLVSNFADAQASAESAGAVPGFGKADLLTEETRRKLGEFL